MTWQNIQLGAVLRDGTLRGIKIDTVEHERRGVGPAQVVERDRRGHAALDVGLGPDDALRPDEPSTVLFGADVPGAVARVKEASASRVTSLTSRDLPTPASPLTSAATDRPTRLTAAEAAKPAAKPDLAKGLTKIRDEIRADAELSERIRKKFRIKNTTGYRLCAFLDADAAQSGVVEAVLRGEDVVVHAVDQDTAEGHLRGLELAPEERRLLDRLALRGGDEEEGGARVREQRVDRGGALLEAVDHATERAEEDRQVLEQVDARDPLEQREHHAGPANGSAKASPG